MSAVDTVALAAFWCAVTGWVVREEDGGFLDTGPADGGPGLDFAPVPTGKAGINRLHLDLRADGDRAAELERLLSLGAVRVDVGQAPDVTWTVLADPEGNEFCLL